MATTPARLTANGVVRSAMALMLSTAGSTSLGVVFWIIGARLASPADLGKAAAAASTITLLGGLAQLSLNSASVRFLPTAGQWASTFVSRAYLASGSTAVLLGVWFFVFGWGEEFLGQGPLVLAAFCAAVMCSAFLALQDGVLTALRRTTWVPIINISIAVAKLILLFLLVSGAFVASMVVAWGIPIIIAVLIITVVIFQWLVPTEVRRSSARQLIPSTRELSGFLAAENLSGSVGSIRLFIPPLLVTAVLGPVQNAYFYVAWLIATTGSALCWNIGMSFVVEATTDPTRIRENLRRTIQLLMLVTVGGAVGLLVGAELILSVLGPEYAAHGTTSLRLIALSLPAQMVIVLFGVCALIAKKTWPNFWIHLIATAFFLGFAYYGLKEVGLVAAAGSYATFQVLVAAVLVPSTLRRLRKLVAAGAEAETSVGRIPAFGSDRTRPQGIATVAMVSPGYDVAPGQVIFLPQYVVDWERLGKVETVIMSLEANTEERQRLDLTIPLQRLDPSDDTTEVIHVGPPGSRHRDRP